MAVTRPPVLSLPVTHVPGARGLHTAPACEVSRGLGVRHPPGHLWDARSANSECHRACATTGVPGVWGRCSGKLGTAPGSQAAGHGPWTRGQMRYACCHRFITTGPAHVAVEAQKAAPCARQPAAQDSVCCGPVHA